MIWLFGLLACGDKTEDSGTPPTPPIDATLRLLSVTSGSSISDVMVSANDNSNRTDENGRATVSVSSNSSYTLRASDENTMDHLYQGIAGSDPFEVVGFWLIEGLRRWCFH